MDSARHRRVKELFLEVRERPAAERGALIAEQSDGDPDLAAEVEALLDFESKRPSFLERSPVAAGDTPAEPAPDPARQRLADLATRSNAAERYDERGTLGSGGMGEVFRVLDTDLRREVAMKIATPDNASSLSRFLEEAQVTGQLAHPGVVPVHEIGVDGEGRPYFTMQLVSGRRLREIFESVRDGTADWTLPRALRVLLQVCETMDYAHSRGVVHRDLKPDNVMVGEFGEVYVLDWGLAAVQGEEDERDLRPRVRSDREDARGSSSGSALMTMDGAVLGTPYYMPPEQAAGRAARLGPRADVYAVGAMLYHLVAGTPPYGEAGRSSRARIVLDLVIAGPPDPVQTAAPEAPAELVAICEKAMARDADARYADMRSLADDLRAYLDGRVVRAHGTGAWVATRKWVGRNRALSSALLLAAVLLAGAAWFQRAQAASRREQLYIEDVAVVLPSILAEVDELFPAMPETLPRIELWQARAAELLARREAHGLRLATLESEAAGGSERLQFAVERQRQVQADLARLADALVPKVERIEAFARTVVERTTDGPEVRELWADAIGYAADPDGPYGFELTTLVGLVPLGRDPHSRLLEFAHLESGTVPARDPETGELPIAEENGLVFVLIPIRGAGAPHVCALDPRVDGSCPPMPPPSAPYFLSKFEMTQAQWHAVTGERPSIIGPGGPVPGYGHPSLGPDPVATALHPVENVSFDDCARVLEKLQLRLPTDEEWTHAALGGETAEWWVGDDRRALGPDAATGQVGAGNLNDQPLWNVERDPFAVEERWIEDGWAGHCPIGSFRPNPFGLHDVAGNIHEWCDKGNGPARERPGQILKGGSWATVSSYSRPRFPFSRQEHARQPSFGVRPARRIAP